jgi:signal transduction histidine kinase
VDLNNAAQSVLDDLVMSIQQTQAQIEIGDLPTVRADPIQVQQLLQNLVANALKFHQAGRPPVIKVSARDLPDNFCEITVEDNGIGFEQKDAENIFIPFERLVSRRNYEGTGIGLSICKKIVERHGGSIRAESEPGKGSKFIINLPK